MNFTTPTTKEQMYAVLQQIFHYYRIEREGFSSETLEELELDRLSFTPLTATQLSENAKTLLGGQHAREILQRKNTIEQEITEITAKKSAVTESRDAEIESINSDYAKSQEKVENQAVKNGLINSSITVDKIASLETAKNQRISEIREKASDKLAEYDAQIEKLNTALSQVDTYFSTAHSKDVSAKAIELKEKQDEIQRNVFKYNNTLEEKELRYRNTITQANTELKLRFMEIQAGEFTKDELVDMGYYDDVLDCVCAYYDKLEVVTAYQDIVKEKRLMIFLDDYYADTVYMYKLRAGA